MMLGLWTFLACGPELPEPELVGVSPSWAYNGEETPIHLEGEHLYPTVHVDAGEDGGQVDAQFVIALLDGDERYELTGVTLEDYTELSARVPPGYPVGVYDLELLAPSGGSATLYGGFEVTDTRADHLAFALAEASHPVFELVSVGLALEDPAGSTVPQAFEVEVRAVSADGAELDLTFSEGGLDDQVVSEGRTSGTLGADGTGHVVVSSETPQDVWLTVSAAAEDSQVGEASVLLSFEPSTAAEVRIDLPSSEFSTVAGETFDIVLSVVDAYGNEVPDQQATVLLTEACGSFREQVSLVGTATASVAVTGATGTSCDENSLSAFGSGMSGVSVGFEVTPGEVTSLDVQPSTEAVTAGEPELQVLLSARDVFDNVVPDYRETLAFRDDLGGLDTESGVGGATCGDWWEGGLLFCTLTFDVAGVATLSVEDTLGVEGRADGITVLPAPAASLSAASGDSPRAGEAWVLEVLVEDAYGNGADIDPAGADTIAVSSDAGGTLCSWTAEREPGLHELSCLSTVAGSQTVSVEVGSVSLSTSLAVEVENGALAVLVASAASTASEAGESVEVTLSATDSWGNSYLTQDEGAEVDLDVDAGTVTPTSVTLGASGTTVEGVALTSAGLRTIDFSVGGVTYGSLDVTVSPGEGSELELQLEDGPAWLDQPSSLTIELYDDWGNLVDDASDTVTVRSAAELFTAFDVDLVDGRAETSLSWEAAGLQDQVLGELDAVSGTSASVDVLDPDCSDPPIPELTLDAGDAAVSCRFSGSASASADASSSRAGDAPLSAWHLQGPDGGWSRWGTWVPQTVTHKDVGGFQLVAVIVDGAACASEASATWWVGDDDGTPTGPLTVSADDSSLVAGTDSTGVDISASDCAGDLASVGEGVLVRADLGDVAGTSTGAGLELTLNASGATTTTWDMAGVAHSGTATLQAGTATGAAWGEVSVTVTGDSNRPTVVGIDPSGATDELFQEVVITFSEPMLDATVDETTVLIDGPDGAEALSSVSLDSDGEVVTASLASIEDAASGQWTVTLVSTGSGGLRDADGNRLDGAYSGTSSDHVAIFGAVDDDAIEVETCTPDVTVFIPDGDAGIGEHADSVNLSVTASSEPARWLVEVYDADEERVQHLQSVATGDAETLSWDGRGSDGRVQAPGDYRVEVSAVDAQDNVSAACEVELRVSQQYGEPE